MKSYLLLAIAFITQNLCGQNDEIYDSTYLRHFSSLAKRQCLFATMMLPDTQQLKSLNFAYYICNANCTLVRVKGFIKGPDGDERYYYDSVQVDYLMLYSSDYVPRFQTQTIHYFRRIYGFRQNDKEHQKQVTKIIKGDYKIMEWLGLPKNKFRRSLRRLKNGCSECLIDKRFLIHLLIVN